MDDFADHIQEFATGDLVPYAYNILAALIIFLIGKWLVRRIANLTRKVLARRIDDTVAKFVATLVNLALLVVVVVAVLDRLGVATTPLVAIVGAAGLAVGLALKDSLGNFAAGVMLMVFRPFRAGDYIEAGGAAGTVAEVRIFATLLISPDNKVITVPNGAIMADNIVNYSGKDTRRVDMQVGVSYSSDLAKVKQVLQDILAADPRVLKDPPPLVVIDELADSSVNLLVRPWAKTADYWALKWDTIEILKRRFDEEGIEIPFPQLDMHHAPKERGGRS